MNIEQAIADLNPVLFTNYDPIIAQALSPNAQQMMAAAIGAVAYLGGHDVSKPFPFDEKGAAIVEKYLSSMVKPYAKKWSSGSNPQITRVLKVTGVTTSKPEDCAALSYRFQIASLVLGQCMGQSLGYEWIADSKGNPDALGRDGKAVFWTFAKVRKFCAYGKEDSLVDFFTVIAHNDRNITQMEAMIAKAKEHGMFIPEDAYHQVWHDENGNLLKIIIRDAAGKEYGQLVVANSGEVLH